MKSIEDIIRNGELSGLKSNVKTDRIILLQHPTFHITHKPIFTSQPTSNNHNVKPTVTKHKRSYRMQWQKTKMYVGKGSKWNAKNTDGC